MVGGNSLDPLPGYPRVYTILGIFFAGSVCINKLGFKPVDNWSVTPESRAWETCIISCIIYYYYNYLFTYTYLWICPHKPRLLTKGPFTPAISCTVVIAFAWTIAIRCSVNRSHSHNSRSWGRTIPILSKKNPKDARNRNSNRSTNRRCYLHTHDDILQFRSHAVKANMKAKTTPLSAGLSNLITYSYCVVGMTKKMFALEFAFVQYTCTIKANCQDSSTL